MALREMYRGNTRKFRLTCTGDLTGGTVHIVIKARDTDADADALYTSTFTIGVYEAEAAGTTICTHTMPASASVTAQLAESGNKGNFPIGTVYVTIEYVSATNEVYTLLSDTMTILRDIRQAI